MCFTGMEFAMLGAVVNAVGTLAGAAAQQQQAEYNAQVAKINAETARQQGQYEADRINDKYQRQQATARVQALKSGVDPGYGSASIIIDQETARNSWLDQMTSVWNRETQATGFDNKAKEYKMQANNAMIGGAFGAAGSLLGGVGKAMGGFRPQIS